jgi:DsbC/DsbD-like thiol-disulfide interchange protein
MIASMLRQRVTIVAFAIALASAGTAARAADASPWDADARAGMRLIAGTSSHTANGPLRAGVEIRLSSGWKTYWRYPGDSGVPPRFDFAASQNVKSVEVAWPAPHAFTDDSGTSIGYKDGVIFPLRVVPEDPKRPVILRLKLDYAVCEKLCVPAEGRAELALPRQSSSLDGVLAHAEALVPRRAKLGDGAPLAVRGLRREGGGDRPRIIVDIAAPGPEPAQLFVEGPTPDWALPVPAPIAGAAAGLRRFAFTLDGVPPGATVSGAALRLTLVANGSAIEVATRLE